MFLVTCFKLLGENISLKVQSQTFSGRALWIFPPHVLRRWGKTVKQRNNSELIFLGLVLRRHKSGRNVFYDTERVYLIWLLRVTWNKIVRIFRSDFFVQVNRCPWKCEVRVKWRPAGGKFVRREIGVWIQRCPAWNLTGISVPVCCPERTNEQYSSAKV